MKKNMLVSLVTVALLAVTTVSFIACLQDEAGEDAKQAKIELLKAKAKEFAKKYGVEMYLNEKKLEEIADTLTVEQMEEDFKAFSEFKGFTFVSQPSNHSLRKGLKIQRTKTTKEESDNNNKTVESVRDSIYHYTKTESISCFGHCSNKNPYVELWENFSGDMTVDCQYGNKCANWVQVTLDLYSGSNYAGGSARLNHSISFANSLMFSAYGNVSVYMNAYRFVFYVTVEYNGHELSKTIAKAS